MSTGESTSPGPSDLERRDETSGMSGWRIVRVTGAFPSAASFWLERNDGSATIQILVRQRGEGQCLLSTPLGDVSYRRVSGLGDREAAQMTRAFAKAMLRGGVPVARYFPHLAGEAALADDGTRLRLAQVIEPAIPLLGDQRGGFLQRSELRTPAELIFDPPGIAEFLEPEITVDGPALLGWVFRGVYLPSVARRQSADFTAYVLEFARDDREQTAQLRLRIDGQEAKAFARSGRLTLEIAHDGDIEDVPGDVSSLASWVAALVRLRSSAALEIHVPKTFDEIRSISYPLRSDAIETHVEEDAEGGTTAVAKDAGPPPALNVALDPDCGQHCVFCSVKSYVTPTDAGPVDLEDVRKQLQQAQQIGVQEVRLNGIDPLQHSRVLDVVDAVRSMGFPRLTVYSPGRRLADPGFRKELLRRAPSRLTISIPLYGRTAETHDTVTGRQGAHREVVEAIEGLRAEGASEAIQVSTVFTKQNAHEIVPMLLWLRDIGLDRQVHAHFPYPMRPTTRDPYADSAMRESELLDRLIEEARPLSREERSYILANLAGAFRHPCLLWHAERSSGLAVLGPSFPEVAYPLAGTEYRSKEFVHASGTTEEGNAFAVAVEECPHAADCALAPVCPREHYSVYAQLYGLAEFVPVRPPDLYRVAPVPDDPPPPPEGDPRDREPEANRGVWSVARATWRSFQKGDSQAK